MPNKTKADAMAVSDRLLRQTGEALMTGNFDLFRNAFHLPHEIGTFEGNKVVETVEDLKAVFDAVVKELRRLGATDLVRYCVEAEFKSETVIEHTHISNTMRGAQRLKDPTSGFSVLKLIDGTWQVASSQYAVPDDDMLNTALIAARATPTISEVSPEMKKQHIQTPS